MKILIMALAIIICVVLYVFIHLKANKIAKDPFEWGAYTGISIAFIIAIVFNLILK